MSTHFRVILWREAGDVVAGYRVDRTRRALAAVGVEIEPELLEVSSLRKELAHATTPILLLSAGVWFPQVSPFTPPPASATGQPVVALGMLVSEAPRGDQASCNWTRQLGTGELDRSTLPPTCPLSVWIPAEVAQAIGAAWQPDWSFGASLARVVDGWPIGVRTIHYSPLDVGWDNRLRVLQVVTSLQRGGAERVVVDLCAELPRCGVSVSVATIGKPTRDPFPVPASIFDLASLGDRARRVARLREVSHANGIDLFHAHLLDGEESRLLAESGIPVLTTVHNQRPGWPVGLTGPLTAENSDQLAQVFVACSAAVESELLAVVDPRRVRTVWNGIETANYRPHPQRERAAREWRRKWGVSPNDLVLLSVANPRPQKELHRLPAILVATQQRMTARGRRGKAHLVFCGEFDHVSANAAACVARLREEIECHGVGSRTHFTGSVAEVAAVFAASQVMVSTSRHEGMSLAQLEALATGIGLVATNVGGVDELATHHLKCRPVPVDASPQEFAEAILEVASRSRSPDSTMTARYFDRRVMARAYRRLFPRVIAQTRRRTRSGLWLVTNNFSTGGAQSSARRLLVELRRRGVPVRAAVLQEQREFPTPGTLALREADVPVYVLPPSGTVTAEDAVAELLAAIDDAPPRAVMFWNALAPYKILLADGLLDVPCFDVSPGEMYFASLAKYFQAPAPGLPYRRSTDYGRRLQAAIVKYAGEVDAAREVLGCAVHVIPNGIIVPECRLEGRGSEERQAEERQAEGWQAEERQAEERQAEERQAEERQAEERQAEERQAEGRQAEERQAEERQAEGGRHTECACYFGKLVLGTAARIHPQKKIEDLLVALRKAHRKMPPYVCRIAGAVDGDARDYADHLRRLGMGLPLEWLGEPTDMNQFLAGLDLFVMISEPAGCPNATLEALAAGVPVVATDWGGAREQILPEVTGLLTPRGDADALAAALARLATDESLRRQFSLAGRHHVSTRFSLGKMVDQYLRVLGL